MYYEEQSGEGEYTADFDYVIGKGKYNPMNVGGTFVGATTIFSSGIGPVSETTVPYKNNEDIAAVLDNGGLNYIHVTEDEIKNNKNLYAYAAKNPDSEDSWYDWSVDESLRFVNEFELSESNILPSPAGSDKNGKYEY